MSGMEDWLSKYAATLTPSAARFILECIALRKIKYSDPIMAVLKEIAGLSLDDSSKSTEVNVPPAVAHIPAARRAELQAEADREGISF